MADPDKDPGDALIPELTEGERQARPGHPAGVMSHQDPGRRHDLDAAFGRPQTD